MRIIFLGTNGWYDTETGNTLSILIETESEYIILDAGSGIHKLDSYISDSKPIYLFLSHFHLDHIIGLHILAKFNFVQGLKIFGHRKTKELLNLIVQAPFTIPLHQLKYKTEIYTIPEDQQRLPFKMRALLLNHSSECLGYRFEIEKKIVAFCTDTGYCDNAVKLARDADLLIIECALKTGQSDEGWPHLNPQGAAKIACEGNVKRLALVHFDAHAYPSFKERKEAEKETGKIFSNAVAAMDDMKIEI